MSFLLSVHAARQQMEAALNSHYFDQDNQMFPSSFYGLFPPFPTTDRVFVAMPFSEKFGLRWEHVIAPAIKSAGLEPHRIDLSITADSIPVKILQEIGSCRLIFADVTSEDGTRNANVMYELGIAQAIRRPEEVLVFRSDDDKLPFDIAPIFAHMYHPDRGPNATNVAVDLIKSTVLSALESVDLTKHLIVKRIVDSLDVQSIEVLGTSLLPPFYPQVSKIPLGKAISDPRLLSGFSRLVAVGVLQTTVPDVLSILSVSDKEPIASGINFTLTHLGVAVAKEFTERYYNGRSPRETYIELVRIRASKLAQNNKITREQQVKLINAAEGGSDVLSELATLESANA